MIRFVIKPFDVLFFGSGKPFNLGGVARSNFPPYTHTFAGAISAIFDTQNPKVIKNIYGPFLYNHKENKLYFPKPANIYKKRKRENIDKLFTIEPVSDSSFELFKYYNTNIPSGLKMLCLNRTGEDLEGFHGIISEEGLKKWIRSENPDLTEVKSYTEVFDYETRIGIKIDPDKNTVVDENGLYRIRFIKMKEEWSFIIYVNFNEQNTELLNKVGCKNSDELEIKIIDYLNNKKGVIKLGGEMKNAYYSVDIVNNPFSNFQFPMISENDHIKILFLNHSLVDVYNLDGLETISYINNGYSNLAVYSNKLGIKKIGFRTISPGSVIYVSQKGNKVNLQKFWFKNIDINIQSDEIKNTISELSFCVNFVTLGVVMNSQRG